ncbi:sel1 repeat family protein [Nisaea acidiphila]|uniref:Sel1 repeat family protein n=1 Tax=Nisaea acidiphila TaxID=1862145 RepID=A0A9J7AQJ1_9PROT|nr:tetratricopeptide repeat protein [Nisaea acidiphila]UUX49430.1 sel1 repeat family protein [Nisaea acidiphila]
MKRALPLLLAFCTFLTVSPALAQAADSKRQTYGEAMDWYREQAEAGDAKAQFYYGLALERGAQGTQGEADKARAVELYKKAAEGGFALAQYRLGVLYQIGQGVGKDLREARKWFGAASEAGLREAEFNYAIMLETGTGGSRDPEEAARLYEIAASKGVRQAFLPLGILFARGEGVDRDLVEALKWLTLADRVGAEGVQQALTAVRGATSEAEQAEAIRRADGWKMTLPE